MASVHALSQAVLDAAKSGVNMDRWALSLRTEADGEDQRPTSRPEDMELRSISHEGRVRWHRKQVFPHICRPERPRPRHAHRHHLPQEQLLYVALYRDKIAQHQAEMETNARAAQAKEVSRQREQQRQTRNDRRARLVPVRPNRSAAKLAAAAATVAGTNWDGSDGGVDTDMAGMDGAAADNEAADVSGSGSNAAPAQQERGASMPPLMIPSERRGQRRSGVAGSGGGGGGDAAGRASGGSDEVASGSRTRRRPPGATSARRSQPAEHGGEDQEGRAATHIASVAAAPGAGGVANEYLETKRLGKLFDEWKAQQQQQVEETPGAASSSPRLSTVRFADGEASQRTGMAAKRMGTSDSVSSRGGAGSVRSTGSGAGTSAAPSRGQGQGAGAGHPEKIPPGSPRAPGASASSAGTTGAPPPSPGHGAAAHSDGGSAATPKAKRHAGRKRTQDQDAAREKELHRGQSAAGRGSFAEEGHDESDIDALSSDLGSDVSHQVGNAGKHDLVSRLFQVVTNPKVTRETFAERGAGDMKKSEVPSQVEGFPTLNLMRLYKGPWRLDV